MKLDQFDKSLHEYMQELATSYSYWKDDISVKAAAYLLIGGLKVGALRTNLMTNWQECKYDFLLTLQNDAAKNTLWRSAVENILRNISSATTQNMGKAPMPMPSYKRLHGNIGQSNHGSHNNLEGNGIKGACDRKSNWGHLKDVKRRF
jgi:hypothetical protein